MFATLTGRDTSKTSGQLLIILATSVRVLPNAMYVLDRSSNVQYSTEYSSVFNQFPFSHRSLCGLLMLVFAILLKSVKIVCLILKHTPLNPHIV